MCGTPIGTTTDNLEWHWITDSSTSRAVSAVADLLVITVVKIAIWCLVCPADRQAWRGSSWHAWCFHRLLCLEYFTVGQSHCRGDIDDVQYICRVLQHIQHQNKTAGGKSARHRCSVKFSASFYFYMRFCYFVSLFLSRLGDWTQYWKGGFLWTIHLHKTPPVAADKHWTLMVINWLWWVCYHCSLSLPLLLRWWECDNSGVSRSILHLRWTCYRLLLHLSTDIVLQWHWHWVWCRSHVRRRTGSHFAGQNCHHIGIRCHFYSKRLWSALRPMGNIFSHVIAQFVCDSIQIC